jgi:hypothetical protein
MSRFFVMFKKILDMLLSFHNIFAKKGLEGRD